MQEILNEFLKNYGVKEVSGSEHNPSIRAMFSEIGFDWVKDDETSWCSAALNYFCKKLGYERSGALDARSWLKMPVMVLKPSLGDIVILWREMKRDHGQVVITDNVNISVQANRRTGKTGNVKMVYEDGKFIEKDWVEHETEVDKAYAALG